MPKDTNSMIYNMNKHRYILTPEGFEERYGINLLDVLDSDGSNSPDLIAEQYLDRVSLILYNYIYSWSQDKNKTEFVISLDTYRDAIEDALSELAYAWIVNNTDPSLFYTDNPLKTIQVPPTVQTILINNSIIYRGQYYMLPNDWKELKGVEY